MTQGNELVVAALSGGVDSATAAGLLVEQGHRVVGMTMRLYDARGTAASSGGRCCGPRDVEDARAVCAHLGIPFYVVDLAAEFSAAVVDDFVEAYLAGETPNPCVKCNQHIKFTPLLERARAIGADVLVTGHYAQILAAGPGGDGHELRRGLDAGKDQSYFLFSMPAHELGSVRFPLGGMTKHEVRAHALRLGLPNATKDESQEICFVPDGDYAGFVSAQALRRGRTLPVAGNILDQDGAVVGRHEGAHRFTIGQHRGLGNLSTKDKLYVTAVDPARAEVRVGPRSAAERRELVIRDLRWLAPARDTLDATVQVRHRGTPIVATIVIDGDRAIVQLAEATVAAPGQAAVIYDADRVLAGGWLA
ncbi:MAG: tRNA 2-thiouridine(34) synthase MnmA [Deltaproteobacteria bacterium]|nr:tRNA 2-thiouridine(34) synthase MnmA [Deltaproteobacteria bacterium]